MTLNVANRVYIKEGNYELDENLEKDAVKVFDAGIEKINFAESEAAASLINNWVRIHFWNIYDARLFSIYR